MELDEYKIAQRIAAMPGTQRPVFLKRLSESGLDHAILPIVPFRRDERIPLSYAQKSLWLTWKIDPASPAYNMQSAVILQGDISSSAFTGALSDLAMRHEILRTVFNGETETELEQIVLPQAGEVLQIRDISTFPRSERECLANEYILMHARQPFDLHLAPAWRALLLKFDEETWWFSIVKHHIVTDGWSTGILIRDLASFYQARLQEREPDISPLPIQFADYAFWQRDRLMSGELSRQLEYWKEKLSNSQPVLPLPLDHPRPSERSGHGEFLQFQIDSHTTQQLRRLAEEQGATAFIVVLTLFKLVLGRFSGTDDISVGSPIANRGRAEIQDLIGYLTNVLVLRTSVNWRMSFTEVLLLVRETVLQAQDNADTPFDLLVSALAGQRTAGVHPLFQVKCTEQSAAGNLQDFCGLSVKPCDDAQPLVHFDLSLDFSVTETAVRCVLAYATDIFSAPTIRRMAAFLVGLAESVAEKPGAPLYTLLPASDNAQAFGEQRERAPDEAVLSLWRRRVDENPNAVSAVHDGRTLTQAMADAQSDYQAARLQDHGVHAETRVAILADRSCEFVVAVLAVWKAGGTCVPLDPVLPEERLAYQVRKAGVSVMLSAREAVWAQKTGTEVLDLALPDALPERRPVAVPVHQQQAAYVIYTSGSTGRPKGVVVSHAALNNYVQAVLERLALKPGQSLAMVSTVAADLGHTMLFGALSSGCPLHMISAEQTTDPDAFAGYMHQHQIDVLKIVPSHLQALLAAASPADVLPSSCLVLGGEATPWSLLDRISELKPGCRVINHYGPTETTVGILTQEVGRTSRRSANLPLGLPLANCHVHVLDAQLNPVPPGVAGELCLGGANIARGYQDRAALTASCFIASPFSCGERLYRSGDRVRMLEDGALEFLGRIDDQIKIRGYRVQLSEVAEVLRAQPGVVQAEVIARDNDNGQIKLCGYLVAAVGQHIDTGVLYEQISTLLPEYMVPAALVLMDALPVTPNGKLDRHALPDPGVDAETPYEAPRGEAEEILAAVWAEVLNVARVGRHDNFFALGGDSILSLKVVARVRKRGLTLVPKQLFEYQSLTLLAQKLEEARNVQPDSIPPNKIPAACESLRPDMLTLINLTPADLRAIEAAVPGGAAGIQDIYPLAPLQEGILFHHVLQERGDAYVTSRLIAFDSKDRLEAFINNFNRVVARQDILRTAVLWEGLSEPVQVVYRHATLSWKWLEPGPAEDVAAWMTAQMHPGHYRIDVRQAPMLRAAAAYDPFHQRWLLVLLIHHLIDDNTTVKQIIEEIALFQQGRESELPVPVPFRNFIAQTKRAGAHKEHETFFRNLLGDIEEPTAPFNLLDIQGNGSKLREARKHLNAELGQSVRRLARARGVSAASIFHLAWALVLARSTGKEDVVFGTVLFGRMQSDEHAERALGIYINTLPIRLRIGHRSVSASLTKTHEVLTALLHHEHASLALAQRCSGLSGNAPLFTTLLNYRYGGQVVEERDPLAWEGVGILDGEERTNYPIGVSVDDLGDGFHLVAQVSQSIEAIRICSYMERAVEQIVRALDNSKEISVCDLSVFGDQELTELQGFEVNSKRYATTAPVHRLFEQQVARLPENIALVFADHDELSYAELNRRANQLAHHLIGLGVRPETLVGLAVERSAEMVVALLGILKAGGTYVPLDLEYPEERLAYIIEDSGIELLLTQSQRSHGLPDVRAVTTIALDTLDLTHKPEHNPSAALHDDHLAYVIYTSGSTGKPKGAANRHGSLSHCMQWMQETYQLTATDSVLHKAAFGFDVSAWELFWPLTAGARLVIAKPGDHRDPARIFRLIRQYQITTINFVPAMLQAFLAHQGIENPTSLRHIICGGEAMPAATQREALARLQGATLQNLYGPTEATIHVTQWTCRDDGRNQVPIGRPVSGICAYVLDGSLNRVPHGVAGELYLGGIGLARGYLNRAALTADRFVASPFEEGGRLYRTGDLAQWDAGGQLEYLGRTDQQVKIRGFRIELEEIETRLLEQPHVREAVVAVQESAGGARLVGYVSARIGESLDCAHLRAGLSEIMPDYMVPVTIVQLPQLPLTPNGKVDRRGLPAVSVDSHAAFEEPRGDIEERLARIWTAVLNVSRVGRQDNFFELGGHSLLMLRLLQRLHDEFPEHSLSLAQLFKLPGFVSQAEALAVPTGMNDRHVMVSGSTSRGTPLYCFPGTLENSGSYRKITEAIETVRPVHAFISHALTSDRWQPCSIESLAAGYAEYIKATAHTGTCALLGWSFGAQLAVETAKQLRGVIDVTFLGLVDPIEHDVSSVAVLSDTAAEQAKSKLTALCGQSAMAGHWRSMADAMSPGLWNYFASELLSSEVTLPLDGPALDSVEYRRWAVIDAMRMLSVYSHPVFDTPLHLWEADPACRSAGVVIRQWQSHLPIVTRKTVEGSQHLDILRAPEFISDLERVLAEIL